MIDKNLLKDIFPFKRQLILVMISNIMQAMMIVAIAYIIAYIADKLLLSRLESSTATPLLVLLFFFFCIKAILNYFNHYQMEKISLNVQSNLRKQLFEKYGKILPETLILASGEDNVKISLNQRDAFPDYWEKPLNIDPCIWKKDDQNFEEKKNQNTI